MNAARKRVARLAIYLECASVVPIINGKTYSEYCAALEKQYCSLDGEVRQRARLDPQTSDRDMHDPLDPGCGDDV